MRSRFITSRFTLAFSSAPRSTPLLRHQRAGEVLHVTPELARHLPELYRQLLL